MNINPKVTKEQTEEILNLYLNMQNNSMKNISEIVGYSVPTITRIVGKYFSGKIFHEREKILILTSKMNNNEKI